MMVLDEKSDDQQSNSPPGALNFVSKFHSNQSNSFQDISLKTKNVTLMLMLEESITSVSRIRPEIKFQTMVSPQ